MTIILSLIFDVKNFNGSMHLDIIDSEIVLFSSRELPAGRSQIDLEIFHWPTRLIFNLSNKNKNDTQCDDQGNIINDKSIEVIGILINNFPLHVDLLDKVFDCQRENSADITHENFWGFNGRIVMDLHSKNPMRYLLFYNNQFDVSKLSWNDNE